MHFVHHLIMVAVSASSIYQINTQSANGTDEVYLQGLSGCPLHLYQIMFEPVCVKNCPPDVPLTFHNLCLPFCPYGYQYNNNNTCRTEYPEVNSSDLCHVTACPIDTPLCYNKQCMSKCPNGTFSDDGNCFHNCSNTNPYVSQHSCVSSCPHDQPYDEDGYCVSACASDYFLYDRKCLKSCPEETFQHNFTCVDECPTEAPKSITVWNVTLCITTCPRFTTVSGNHCELACLNGREYLWNGSCVSKCPGAAPYTYDLSGSIPPYKLTICTERCPTYSYLQGNQCAPNCTFTTYQINSTCVSECPETHQYLVGKWPPFQCVTVCRPPQIPDINHCVDVCPADRYVFNHTCMEGCPESHSFKVNQTCFSQCPAPMVVYDGTCQLACPDDSMYVNNGQCECPASRPFHHQTRTGHVECQTTAVCPEGTFSWNNKCLYQCPDNTYTYVGNATCLEECPFSHQFKYRSDYGRSLLAYECVSECPENTFMKDEFCYDFCDAPYVGFLGNYTCMEKCPDSHKWRSATTTITNQLVFTCAANCSAPRLIDDDQCLLGCPASKPFAVNQTCLKQCPDNLSLITPLDSGRTCSETCPDEHIQDNDTCVLRCSPGKVIIDSVCVDVKYCVNEYQYIEYSQHGTICRKRCLENQFINNIRCVTSCPLFSAGQYCVDKCPSFQRFTREKNVSDVHADKKCYEECPRKTYTNGTKCIDIDCPIKYLADSRECVPACTTSHPYLQEEVMCVGRCPDGYVIDTDNSCIKERHCLRERGRFVYDEHCVSSCPPGTFVNYINNSCILTSVVYLLVVAAVLGTISATAGLVWFYYHRKRKNCKTCFSKMQERCNGDTPLLTEDTLSEGYAMADMVNDPPSLTSVVL
ncbi:balbiani ring protein 3-like isoform X2 [Pecten maximus]|uniref:balbiani ring protein 3-like isoform X2 n=1 Tax=Pecten maximus TaxID=6579 RepID=UPI0014584A40|nr:balbiani ring protein 3-like isoform X2 [Pecten maximus]